MRRDTVPSHYVCNLVKLFGHRHVPERNVIILKWFPASPDRHRICAHLEVPGYAISGWNVTRSVAVYHLVTHMGSTRFADTTTFAGRSTATAGELIAKPAR